MLVSANRTVVRLVTAQPVGGAELADPGLDLTLQCLEPGELVHTAGQLLEEGDNQCADRGVTLRGGDPGVAVDVIGDGYRNVFHSFTVTQFLWLGLCKPGARRPAIRPGWHWPLAFISLTCQPAEKL